MAHIVAHMSVSLDGFVADPSDGVQDVFVWYGKPQPAQLPREPDGEAEAMGVRVIVYGRRTFRPRERLQRPSPPRVRRSSS